MDDQQAARDVALRYVDYAPRSAAEVRRRLHRGGFDDAVIEAVLAELQSAGLVDDARLSQDWVESRQRARGIGRARLSAELRRKGIPRDLVDAATQNVDPESEYDSALALARKRLSGEVGDIRAARQRVAGYLLRRGYDWETIERVFSAVLGPEGN
jgi:regulatory protein